MASGEIEQSKDIEETRLRWALRQSARPTGRTTDRRSSGLNWLVQVESGPDDSARQRCAVHHIGVDANRGMGCHHGDPHIGLRPFTSQLLCEQVVGRGLRRSRYDVLNVDDASQIPEESAKVYGVPFEIIPFKANPKGAARRPPRYITYTFFPEREYLAIGFPRVEGYTFVLSGRIEVDWQTIPVLRSSPTKIPDEVVTKGLSWTEGGRPTL